MVTAVLAVLAVAAIVFCYTFPLERYLPAAIVTARQVDELIRFMSATGSALYIFVAGYLVYFAIAFRAKASDPTLTLDPAEILEADWYTRDFIRAIASDAPLSLEPGGPMRIPPKFSISRRLIDDWVAEG